MRPLECGDGRFLIVFHRTATMRRQAWRFAVMLASAADGISLIYNARRGSWKLPGGRVDPGETPRRAAERDLSEEAGWTAGSTTMLAEFATWRTGAKPQWGVLFSCRIEGPKRPAEGRSIVCAADALPPDVAPLDRFLVERCAAPGLP